MGIDRKKLKTVIGEGWNKSKEFRLHYLLVPAAFIVPAYYLPKLFLALGFMFVTVAVAVATKYYELKGMGVETATFATVISSTVFEPGTSAVLAFIYITLQMFAGGNTGVYIFWVIPSFTAAGFILPNFTGIGVVQLGIMTAVALQGFFSLMTGIFSRGYLPIFLRFVVLNILINTVLFTALAEPLLNALGV
jgi:hypothetical protein